ncbi:MAG: aromatic amino acid ammonia-lyase [candidate division WOR-3 bacterium]|nr:aromatic amino acid ammonia-lyase [candidate division WOR-3 bacterium]
MIIKIPVENLNLDFIKKFLSSKSIVKIKEKAKKKISKANNTLKRIIEEGNLIYGVNTGFGALVNKKISKEEIKKLQYNLIISHALGEGEYFNKDIVKLAIFLRANMLAKGYSGVRVELINALLDLINKDIIPCVQRKGSVGASGDLSPLAQIALVLLGKGKVFYKNEVLETERVFKKEKIKPFILDIKEGLSLINGTEMMSAFLGYLLIEIKNIFNLAKEIAGLTTLMIKGNKKEFDLRLHKLKPYPEQIETAKIIYHYLNLCDFKETSLQDPYSIRCQPQIFGSIGETIDFAKRILEIEINSITDNPIIINNEIFSGGNFMGSCLALASDLLGISITLLSLLSERKIFYLTSGKNPELPIFLIKNPGINSGLMMAQIVSTALISENKILSYPASITSLPTSANQEDIVSMGMNSLLKLEKIVENTKTILAIEILCISQALRLIEINFKEKPKIIKIIEENIPYLEEDKELQDILSKIKNLFFDRINPPNTNTIN